MLLEIITLSRAWCYPIPEDPLFLGFINKRDFFRRTFPISASAQELLHEMMKMRPSSRPSIQTIRELVQELDTFFMTDEELEGPLGTESNRTIAKMCIQRTLGPPLTPQSLNLIDPGLPFLPILSASAGARIACDFITPPSVTMESEICLSPLIPIASPERYKWDRPWEFSMAEFVIGSVSSIASSRGPITPEALPANPSVRVESIELADIELVQRLAEEDTDAHIPAIAASEKGKLYVRDFRKLAQARKLLV